MILFIDELHTVIGAGAAEGGERRGQSAEAGTGARRTALHRCDDARRISQAHRERRRSGTSLSARICRRADGRRHDCHSARTQAALRSASQGVKIKDSALVAAANLSHRYITDRFLPDKAIDLMDEAASRLAMELRKRPERDRRSATPARATGTGRNANSPRKRKTRRASDLPRSRRKWPSCNKLGQPARTVGSGKAGPRRRAAGPQTARSRSSSSSAQLETTIQRKAIAAAYPVDEADYQQLFELDNQRQAARRRSNSKTAGGYRRTAASQRTSADCCARKLRRR